MKILPIFLICILCATNIAQCFDGALPSDQPIPSFTNTSEITDFGFIKKALSQKDVVLLGESSHGIGDYYPFKSNLIQYLHKELGYDVLLMESGIADIHFQYQNIAKISATELRNNTVYGNFQCNEIMPLFEYIKKTSSEPSPLYYAGFDSQNFGSSLQFLEKILLKYSPDSAHIIVEDINRYYHIPALMWTDNKTPLYTLADSIICAASKAQVILDNNEANIRQEFNLTINDFAILKRAISNYIDAVDINWNTDNPIEKRDSLMAENLSWLVKNIYPGKKLIIWGHNAHTNFKGVNGNSAKWLGYYVKKNFGKKSYHIGLFSLKGESYEWWTHNIITFHQNKENDFENLVHHSGEFFIDFKRARKKKEFVFLNQEVNAFEVENGGIVSFIPTHRFDAIILLEEVKAPKFD